MKKLIIACTAVLVIGVGLTTVGHVLGGQFYSVYYDGALHPFNDAAREFSDQIENITDHYVSPDDEIDSSSDTGWVQDYLDGHPARAENLRYPYHRTDAQVRRFCNLCRFGFRSGRRFFRGGKQIR